MPRPGSKGTAMAAWKELGRWRSLLLFVTLLQMRVEATATEAAMLHDMQPPTFPEEQLRMEEEKNPAEESCDPSSPEMQTRISRVRHASAVIAGFADGAMAQLPGASIGVVPCIQAAMIYAIAHQYSCFLDRGSAIAIVTMLSSDYVKTSLVSHAVGWIPVAGNLLKTGLSVVMTEGIGMAAEKMLSCPVSRQQLLAEAAKQEQHETGHKEAYPFREHFHAIVDFLCNTSISSTTEAAREVWRRVESLFRQEDQVALLAKVHEARTPENLVDLVQEYKWNLKVVEASLEALRDRFPSNLACTDVDRVAKGLWATQAADGEVKAVVAPHLLHCWSFLHPDVRNEAAIVAQDLAVEAARAGSATVLPGALALLLAAFRSGASRGLPSAALLDGLMKAVNQEANACYVLREVFSQEAFAEHVSAWVQLQHLQHLDHLEACPGSEMCLPGLKNDIKLRLTLPSLPTGVEFPNSKRPKSEIPKAKALDQAFSGLVGQNCAVKRLMQSPGYVRLRKKGIQRPGVPLVLLLTGPSGTGKTMAARKLAEYIHGRPIQELQANGRYKLFPMNQFRMEEDLKTFFGPPRGIQGSGDLPDLVRPNPDAVIVLDEIEKAHPSFARALLTVFGEYGTVYDPRTGRDYPASNITFVLTSNLAKDVVIKHPAAVAKTRGRSLETHQPLPKGADVDPDCTAYADIREVVEQEMSHAKDNAFFRESEIRGRLTDTLPFLPFGPHEVEEAVRGFLTLEAEAFAKSHQFANLELTWTEDVVHLFANLYARKPDEGLRAVNKQLQSQVRDPLERAVDLGLVPRQARVLLRLVQRGAWALDLRVVPQEPHAARLQSTLETPVLSTSDPRAPEEVTATNTNGTFFSLVSDAIANLGSPFESSPSPPTVAPLSSSSEWQTEWDWEWQSELDWLSTWEWEQLWEYLLLFLWKWRFPLGITALCLFAAISAGFGVPAAAPAAAAVTVAAPGVATATGATAVGATAMAVASWALALVQVAGSSASVAVPALTFFYAWKNKHYIEAVIFCSVALALCPWALRIYRVTYNLLHSSRGPSSKPRRGSKKAARQRLDMLMMQPLQGQAETPRSPRSPVQEQVPESPQHVVATEASLESPEKPPSVDDSMASPEVGGHAETPRSSRSPVQEQAPESPQHVVATEASLESPEKPPSVDDSMASPEVGGAMEALQSPDDHNLAVMQ